MVKKIINYALLVALSLSSVSCLDKYPTDSIPEADAGNTTKQINELVIGLYSDFKSKYLYSGNLTLLPDLQTDLAYMINGSGNTYGNIWRNNIQTTDTDIEGVYGALYAVVGQANLILQKAAAIEQSVSDADYEKLQSYKGEAYFARALANSELIKLFCQAYDPATADKQLGIVLATKLQDNDLTRASLKDSYASVLSDLTKAAELLKIDDDDTSTIYNLEYFSEYTVYALRARVCLYMKDWDGAIEYASKVINSNKYTLSSVNTTMGTDASGNAINAFRYMWQYDNATETIWKVGFTATSYGGALGTVFFNVIQPGVYKPDYVPAKWVLDAYSSSDGRYDAYFQTVTTAHTHQLKWPLLAKYFGNQNFIDQLKVYGVTMPKVFRLAEQYLIRAEAYCRQGLYGKASDDLSTLLKARYSTSFGSISVTESNWFNTINEERVKELYMEGFRLQDIKRWGADGLLDGFTRTPQSQSMSTGDHLTIKGNDYRLVWPIPNTEVALPGSHIQQNEGYK